MFHKISYGGLIVVLLFSLSACSTVANNGADIIDQWAADADKSIFADVSEGYFCEKKVDVKAELAVPGKIEGFDCVSGNGKIQVIYREYEDTKVGLVSASSWVMNKNDKYSILINPHWYAIYDKKIAKAAANILPDSAMDFYGEHEYVKETADIECAQITSALIFDYAYDKKPFEEFVKPELSATIEKSYASLYAEDLAGTYERESADLTILLGNSAEKVNLWCSEHQEVYVND